MQTNKQEAQTMAKTAGGHLALRYTGIDRH